MDFLKKDVKEYETMLGYLLLNKKRLNKKPLKTFLWLPTKESENAHMYFYLDDYIEYEGLSKLVDISINNICYESELNKEKYLMTNIRLGNISISKKAKDWFLGYAEIKYFKHLLKTYNYSIEKETEFIFSTSKSRFFQSKYTEIINYNGERELKGKEDLLFDNLKHLGINKIIIDTSPFQNLLKIDFTTPCKHLLEFYKKKLPIVKYIFSVISFIEHRRVDFFKTFGVINNVPIDYYLGNRAYKEEKQTAYEMIDFRDFNRFFKHILSKKFEEMKILNNIITRFNIINSQNNILESKITGLVYLLERIIRIKGKNPNKKKDFLKEEEIYNDDLIDIKILKNVRNCISHGYEELPSSDLRLVHWNQTMLIQRIILKELNWNPEETSLSIIRFKDNHPFYKKKMMFKGKRKCLGTT